MTRIQVQRDSGEKINILGGDTISHCDKNKFV